MELSWILLETMGVLASIKALFFITSLNSCSQACACKPAMGKESHQFWHPCGIKWHANWIYRLLRGLPYKWKFPGAILHSGLVFSPSATSLVLLRGTYTMPFTHPSPKERYISCPWAAATAPLSLGLQSMWSVALVLRHRKIFACRPQG